VTRGSWRQRAAVAALALLFLCLPGVGAGVAEACCEGARTGMNAHREVPGALCMQVLPDTMIAGGCCRTAGACHCGAPERPFSDELPAGALPSWTERGPQWHASAFPCGAGPITGAARPCPDLKPWLLGVGPPSPLFLFHLAILC
jgi:hypothetical protein